MLDTEHTGSEYWTAGQNKNRKQTLALAETQGKQK